MNLEKLCQQILKEKRRKADKEEKQAMWRKTFLVDWLIAAGATILFIIKYPEFKKAPLLFMWEIMISAIMICHIIRALEFIWDRLTIHTFVYHGPGIFMFDEEEVLQAYTPRFFTYWIWRFLIRPWKRKKEPEVNVNDPELMRAVIDYIEKEVLDRKQKIVSEIESSRIENRHQITELMIVKKELVLQVEKERTLGVEDNLLDQCSLAECTALISTLEGYDEKLLTEHNRCSQETLPVIKAAADLKRRLVFSERITTIARGRQLTEFANAKLIAIQENVNQLADLANQAQVTLEEIASGVKARASAKLELEYSPEVGVDIQGVHTHT